MLQLTASELSECGWLMASVFWYSVYADCGMISASAASVPVLVIMPVIIIVVVVVVVLVVIAVAVTLLVYRHRRKERRSPSESIFLLLLTWNKLAWEDGNGLAVTWLNGMCDVL